MSNNLIRLRKSRGESLVSFSGKLGISKSTLQAIEQGHAPRLDTVELIADSLSVPVEYLLSDRFELDRMRLVQHTAQTSARWNPEDLRQLFSLGWQLAELFRKYR